MALDLLRLRGRLMRASLGRRLVKSAPRGATVVGWVGEIFPTTLLVLAGVVLAVVSGSLMATLRAREELRLAAGVAGALVDGGWFLATVAVAIGDPYRADIDPRPLLLLPIRRSAGTMAELVGLAFLHPAAVVIWSLAGALTWGGLAGSRRALGLAAPIGIAAVGAALAAAAATRSLCLIATHRAPRGWSAPWTRAAVIAATWALLWVGLGPQQQENSLLLGYQDRLTPGGLAARAFALAWRGQIEALAPCAALAIAAFGLVVLAWWRPALPPGPAPHAVRRDHTSWRRVWGLPRALPPLAQAGMLSALVFGFGWFAARHGVGSDGLGRLVAVACAWLIASAPAPLLANPLGLGGPPAAAIGLLPAAWGLQLRRTMMVLIAAPALTLTALAILIGLGFGPEAGWLALCIGSAQLALGAGCGALCGVLWPWSMPLADDGEASWGPGLARLAIPMVQAIPLALLAWGTARHVTPIVVGLCCTVLAVVSALLMGALACRWLRRHPHRVSEALLS